MPAPLTQGDIAERFRSGAVKTRDEEVLTRLRALGLEHAVSVRHQAGLQYLGSDFTFAKRISADDCKRLELPAYYAGSTVCLIRLHPQIEKTFGIFAEVPVVYSPYHDLRSAFVRSLPQILEVLPLERRQVERSVFFISVGGAPHDQVKRHSTPELRLVHLPYPVPEGSIWGDVILEDLAGSLFATDLYSRQGYVVGEQFYGRQQVILQLQSNVANHRVSGVFGLRKTGKPAS